MGNPNDQSPGNFGDVQPWRARRGVSDFPLASPCEEFTDLNEHGLSPRGYGYPMGTCVMCGHLESEHEPIHKQQPEEPK